ncbi:hypothetical protein PYCC9005_003873 [Savitreella phatthalungensis]
MAKKAAGKKAGAARRGDEEDDNQSASKSQQNATTTDGAEEESTMSNSALKKAKREAKKASKSKPSAASKANHSDDDDDDDDDKFDLKVDSDIDDADVPPPAPIKAKPAAKKKSAPQNAFDLLNGDDEDEDEEEEEEDDSRAAPANAFNALSMDDDDDFSSKKKKKSSTSSKSKSKSSKSKSSSADAGSNDEEAQDEEDADQPKLSRKEKKKGREERKNAKKAAAAKADEETDEEEVQQPGVLKKSAPANYAYASGQLLGPDGTNPADGIAVTGNLTSPDNARDLQIDKLTVQAYGKLLIKESDLSLINGRRYGLIAPNGSGKSTLLHGIACGLVPRPSALDVYLLDREYAPTEQTCVEAVLDIVERERIALEDQMGELYDDPDKNAVQLDYIQNRLTELTTEGGENKVKTILKGLSFSDAMLNFKTKDLSGGWRMRIALARILFVKPTLMMLDEPTNHLDLEAVVWLEEYLLHECKGQTLLITSHSQETLNEVCTDIIHLYHQHLDHYAGNYDTFTKVRAERDVVLQKRAKKEEKQLKSLQNKLNMVGSEQQKQAKAAKKAMEKRAEKEKAANSALDEEIVWERELVIKFQECGGGIPAPAVKFMNVDFAYPGKDVLLKDMSFGLDLTSRIALVGPNGAGKTTLLKLILGKLEPTSGTITKHHHLRLSHFHQHMGDQLDLSKSAVEWLCGTHPSLGYNAHTMRGFVGRYGLTGKSQVIPMRQLSDGQRRRVLFAHLGLLQPHMLLFDEPTNALDLDTIDALAAAINNFDGGCVVISHDFRLIEQVAEEVWIVDNGQVVEFDEGIREYKQALKLKYEKERLGKTDEPKIVKPNDP